MSEATTTEGGVAESTAEDFSSEEVVQEEASTEEHISEEGSEESEGASEEVEETAEESTPEEGKYEVTVDGQKLQLTREELMKGFQLGASSHKRFKEAAQLRKEAEQTLSQLKQNPLDAFLKAGGDEAALRSLAEEYLYDKISYEKMSPEEQELADLRRYKTEQEQVRETEAQRKQREAQEQQTVKYQEEFTQTFTDALSTAGLPVSDKAIASIAKIQLDALDEGWEMPIDLAVDHYKNEQNNNITSYLSSLEADQLIKVLGKDKMNQIRKHEVSKLKNPQSRKRSSAPAQGGDVQKENATDFFASLKA